MGKKRKSPAIADAVAASSSADVAWSWPALTGLRGLAALAVFCLHTWQMAGKPPSLPSPLAWLFAMGGMGVDVFFVLSAFLLTLPYVRAASVDGPPRPAARRYAWRRLARVVPAYYAQIALMVVFGWLGLGGALAWTVGWPQLLAHAAFWMNAWPLIPAHVPPWWTLPVEMGFYLLLPALTRWLRPGRIGWIFALIALSLCWRGGMVWLGIDHDELVYWLDTLPGRLHQFLVGMLAAYAFVLLRNRLPPRANRFAGAVAVVSIAALVALPALGYIGGAGAYVGGPDARWFLLPWHLLAAILVATLLVALTCAPRWLANLLASPPLHGLGTISYSFYLWQYPVLAAMRDGLGGFGAVRADFVSFLVYGGVASLLAAIASWWLVERPAQAWSHRVRLPA